MADVQLVPPLLPNWPILMPTDMASRYLSLDELTFLQLAERVHLKPVKLGTPLVRWRRTELDRFVSRLENPDEGITDPRLTARRDEDAALAQRIVDAVAARVSAAERDSPSLMMSVKDAAKTIGIGHSSIWADVEALFAQGPAKPTGRRVDRPACS